MPKKVILVMFVIMRTLLCRLRLALCRSDVCCVMASYITHCGARLSICDLLRNVDDGDDDDGSDSKLKYKDKRYLQGNKSNKVRRKERACNPVFHCS